MGTSLASLIETDTRALRPVGHGCSLRLVEPWRPLSSIRLALVIVALILESRQSTSQKNASGASVGIAGKGTVWGRDALNLATMLPDVLGAALRRTESWR
jgi:hypothetical protein